jgi:type VI secretion system protein ImpM
MTTHIIKPPIAYFGKIPSHGDFVKSKGNLPLTTSLDQWMAQTTELMTIDPRWKIIYDAIPPIHFAFLGSQNKLAIAGHMIASQDASARRFPFLAVSMFEVKQPMSFMGVSPLVINLLWSKLAAHLQALPTSSDPGKALLDLEMTQVDIDVSGNRHTGFHDFIELQTIAGLEQLLKQNDHPANLRRMILALGMLLQPVMQSGSNHLEKGLALPLPKDPVYRSLVASFWLVLVSPFLARADFEIALFIGEIIGKQRLVIGFNGASPKTLHGVIAPEAFEEHHMVIDDATWVENHLDENHGIQKLTSYLDQPQLSLTLAIDTFREVFIGD